MENTSQLFLRRELLAQRERLEQLRKSKEENGIIFYRPHLKQHKFHTCNAKHRYLRFGNRGGKSECGISEDISMALGGRLWYRNAFDILGTRLVNGVYETYIAEAHPGGHNHPYVTLGIPQRPIKILILVVDWDKAKSVFTNREGSYEVWGKLWKLLPTSTIGKVTNGGRGDRIVKVEVIRPAEFGGGISTIAFDTVESYKHNKMGAESDDWDYIHVDEPVPEQLFKAHSRGLMDRNGSSTFTCTPLDEMWINDAFCPPGQRVVQDADKGIAFANRYMITGSSYDNPYGNIKGIQDFESTLTKAERDCRILGIPAAFSGLIYREFEYDVHVLREISKGWKAFNEPPLDYTIRVAWDVHDSKPQAILFAATAPTGETFIFDEMFYDRVIGVNAIDLKQRLAGRFVIDYLIDPRAVIESPVTDESILDELFKYELFFEKASKDLTLGISKVREKLKERLPNSAPTIYFSPGLIETLYEFSHYVYKDGKVRDAEDHMMENLYRLVLNGLDYIAPTADEEFVSKPLSIGLAEYAR